MLTGIIQGNKVFVEDGKEFYDNGWYGKLKDKDLKLDLIEALLLCERGRLEAKDENGKKMKFNDFFHFCSSNDSRFMCRYFVYRDLRERGLPVRIGFEGCDFRVYDRGAKPGKAEAIKWIVFATAEDYPCQMEQLGKAIKLSQNIRATALWAVVDNDEDCTFYIINEVSP